MCRGLLLLLIFFSELGAADEFRWLASETKNADEKKDEKDVDEIITNVKLRAETGSKSLWSIRSSFYYYASSVSKPFAEVRPNIAGS